MFPLLETAAAFAAVMLVVSMFVSAIVQAIQSALRLRGKLLEDMLSTLVHSYREPGGGSAEDAGVKGFVESILTHRLLHTHGERAAAGADRRKLALGVEYLDGDDLVALLRAQPKLAEGVIDDVEGFAAHVARWYDTIGATASQALKKRLRRVTLAVSCVVVLLFNLDGIHLLGDLYRDQATRQALAHEVESLRQSSLRYHSSDSSGEGARGPGAAARRDPAAEEMLLEMKRTSALLEDGGGSLGWPSSFIVKRWRLYLRGSEEGTPRPSPRIAADTVLWLSGVVFSCVMLSLGAPFWVTTLGGLVNIQNEVKKLKTGPDAKRSEEDEDDEKPA